MEFYTEQRVRQNEARYRRLLWILGGLTLAFAAVIAMLLFRRAGWSTLVESEAQESGIKWMTIGLTLVWGSVVLFLWEMKVSPVRLYGKYMRDVLEGLRHDTEGVVVSLAREGTYKDGVFFSVLIINVDPKMDPEGERLFYVDRAQQRPDLMPGDGVRLTSNGNFVTAWEKKNM